MTVPQPPIYEDLGPAPAGVCSRWLGDSPCGAAADHHVIWDTEAHNNGAVCPAHVKEIRQHWVYAGLHPYEPACAASGHGAIWLMDEDRCVMEGPPAEVPFGCVSAVTP
jgi:hypothetical protein